MSVNKENRLSLAKESLAMAQKMLSRLEGGEVPAAEMTRVADAATQATQAAQQLNQLVGILQSELSRS
jgi:hypothetical protein